MKSTNVHVVNLATGEALECNNPDLATHGLFLAELSSFRQHVMRHVTERGAETEEVVRKQINEMVNGIGQLSDKKYQLSVLIGCLQFTSMKLMELIDIMVAEQEARGLPKEKIN